MEVVFDYPFFSFDEQIDYLKNEYNLVIDDRKKAKRILSSVSYYNIINRYKCCFMNSGKYDGNTTIEDLYEFHKFDHDVQNILFKYSIQVENIFKTNLSYIIGQDFGAHQEQYLNINNYVKSQDVNRQAKLKGILKDIRNVYNKSDFEHIDYPTKDYHQKTNIPPWILFKNVKFSTCIDLYSFLKREQKDKICNLIIPNNAIKMDDKKKFLKDALTIVRRYRNRIAHDLSFINFLDVPKIDKCVSRLTNNELFNINDYNKGLGVVGHYSLIVCIYILLRDKNSRISFLKTLITDFFYDEILHSDLDFIRNNRESIQNKYMEICNFPDNFLERLNLMLRKSAGSIFDYSI